MLYNCRCNKRIKQSLGDFCLFIPTSNDGTISSANLDQYLHERNSIHVLQNSCAKSKCQLEFEIKSKTASAGKSANKTLRITGDQALTESDEDMSPSGLNSSLNTGDAQIKIK